MFIHYSLLQQSINIYEFMFDILKYNKGLSCFLLGYSWIFHIFYCPYDSSSLLLLNSLRKLIQKSVDSRSSAFVSLDISIWFLEVVLFCMQIHADSSFLSPLHKYMFPNCLPAATVAAEKSAVSLTAVLGYVICLFGCFIIL